jgi:DUF1680 family protein
MTRLLRLYRAAGDRRYLDFSITLTEELCTVGPKVAEIKAGGGLHAVRVGYLLAAMADLYPETGSEEMLQYLPGLWDEAYNELADGCSVKGASPGSGFGIAALPGGG